MASDLAQTPFPGQSLEEILASLAATPGEAEFRAGRFRDFTVTSHFQPIVSLSHRRIVGYEGLMRGRNDSGAPVSPLDLLAAAASNFKDLHYLDRLSRIVHMANYTRQDSGSNWLFLNMHPQVFLQSPQGHDTGFLLDIFHALNISPHRLVIEVLEQAVRENAEFGQAVDFFRELGCLIALDDFGAGHSNFDRVWSIRPEIVKLDRSLILQAGQDIKIRRTLPQIVSLLHEAGAMVLMEGVETSDEAYIALESDVDFVQGFHFGHPAPRLVEESTAAAQLNAVWEAFDHRWQREQETYHQHIAPYINALGYASVLLSAGRSLEESCHSFLSLENSEFCYLLDSQGRQQGTNLWGQNAAARRDIRFAPLSDTRGARWSRRPYFRRAIGNFSKVQVTRPYLSISSATLCVTLSCSFKVDGEIQVVAGDMRWPYA